MNIGIIGAGSIGRLYAELWYKAGHKVFISSRTPEDHQGFVEKLGCGAFLGSVIAAAEFGDVILLATNYESVDSAVSAIAPYTDEKLVIDATNPLRYTKDGQLERMIGERELAAEVMAGKLPDARIAKALTTLWSGHVEAKSNVDAPQVAMPFAADREEDQEKVRQLIEDAGLAPVNIGGLAQSAPLDPGSPIWNVVLTKEELVDRVADYRCALAT